MRAPGPRRARARPQRRPSFARPTCRPSTRRGSPWAARPPRERRRRPAGSAHRRSARGCERRPGTRVRHWACSGPRRARPRRRRCRRRASSRGPSGHGGVREPRARTGNTACGRAAQGRTTGRPARGAHGSGHVAIDHAVRVDDRTVTDHRASQYDDARADPNSATDADGPRHAGRIVPSGLVVVGVEQHREGTDHDVVADDELGMRADRRAVRDVDPVPDAKDSLRPGHEVRADGKRAHHEARPESRSGRGCARWADHEIGVGADPVAAAQPDARARRLDLSLDRLRDRIAAPC